MKQAFSRSNREEIIGILWLIAGSQFTGIISFVCYFWAISAMVFSIRFALLEIKLQKEDK